MNNKKKIQMLVGVALLTALVVVFQLIGNYVVIGTINITLALIPIAVGAILYGPLVGGFLGLVMGAIALTAPSTGTFLAHHVGYTVLVCLTKSSVAGLVAGLVFKIFSKIASHHEHDKNVIFVVGIIVSTLVIPIINTGLFMFEGAIFFQAVFGVESFGEAIPVIIGAVLTTNFIIEFSLSVVLSPVIVYAIKVLVKTTNLGFSKDFALFNIRLSEEE